MITLVGWLQGLVAAWGMTQALLLHLPLWLSLATRSYRVVNPALTLLAVNVAWSAVGLAAARGLRRRQPWARQWALWSAVATLLLIEVGSWEIVLSRAWVGGELPGMTLGAGAQSLVTLFVAVRAGATLGVAAVLLFPSVRAAFPRAPTVVRLAAAAGVLVLALGPHPALWPGVLMPSATPRLLAVEQPEAVPAPRTAPPGPVFNTSPAGSGSARLRLLEQGRPPADLDPRHIALRVQERPDHAVELSESWRATRLPEVTWRVVDGLLEVPGLPLGRWSIRVLVSDNGDDPDLTLVHGGDLEGYATVDLKAADETVSVAVDLRRSIRLREPEDNRYGFQRAFDAPPHLHSPVTFRWDRVLGATEYRARLFRGPTASLGLISLIVKERIARGFGGGAPKPDGETTTPATTWTVALPPSRPGECYYFSLDAVAGTRQVASFAGAGRASPSDPGSAWLGIYCVAVD
jgi:hypothetical protein